MPFLVHGKVHRTEIDVRLPHKRQDSFLDIGRRGNDLHLDVAEPRILSPVERLFRIAQRKRIKPVAHQHHADVEFLVDHVLINAGSIGEDLIRRQPIGR